MAKTVGLTFPVLEKLRLQCPHCDNTYANDETLAQHIKDKHSEVAASEAEEREE